MKKAGILIALVALLYLGGSFALGFVIQSRMAINGEDLRAKAPYLSVKSQTFDHGLFHSNATTVITFSPAAMMPAGSPKVGNLAFDITVKQKVAHGPICGLRCVGLAKIDTTVDFPPIVQALLDKTFGSDPWLSIRTHLDLLGGSSTDISSPPVADARFGGAHFSSEGLNGAARVSRDGAEIDFDGALPRLLFSADGGARLDLQALTVKTVSRRVLPQFYNTDVDFAIDRLDTTGVKTGSSMTIQKLSYVANNTVSGGFSDMALKLDSGDITSAQASFKAIHFDVTLKHLKLEALQALREAQQSFNGRLQGATQAQRQEMLARLKEPLSALLVAGAEIHLDRVGFETDTGAAVVSGNARLPNVAEQDFAGDNPWKRLITKADADFQVSIDDAALAGLPGAQAPGEQLQKFADQGYLVHANGKWTANLHFAAGTLTANGKPINGPAQSAAAR